MSTLLLVSNCYVVLWLSFLALLLTDWLFAVDQIKPFVSRQIDKLDSYELYVVIPPVFVSIVLSIVMFVIYHITNIQFFYFTYHSLSILSGSVALIFISFVLFNIIIVNIFITLKNIRNYFLWKK